MKPADSSILMLDRNLSLFPASPSLPLSEHGILMLGDRLRHSSTSAVEVRVPKSYATREPGLVRDKGEAGDRRLKVMQ